MHMKFRQLDVAFWILLLSCAWGQSYGRWEPKISVTVTNTFLDQRHITIACQSYTKTEAEKYILKDLLVFPNNRNVQYDVEKFSKDTIHRCVMVWKRDGTDEEVFSILETFSGSWDHNVISVWDDEGKSIKYKWSVTETGLSLYCYSANAYLPRRTLRSIQDIEVYVTNDLHGPKSKIYILCNSNHPERQEIVSKSIADGEFEKWSAGAFDVDTVQVCKVRFHDGKIDELSFEAFLGKWHHDDSIWDEEKKERRYDWVVEDNGLFVQNFETKQYEFIKALPSR